LFYYTGSRSKRAIPGLNALIDRFQSSKHEIRDKDCGIIIQWARGKSGPGVNMNFKTKFDNNWNHEHLDGDRLLAASASSHRYNVDVTKERVDGGKLELIRFWWDKVSDIIIALS
jgi:hypothetical protein